MTGVVVEMRLRLPSGAVEPVWSPPLGTVAVIRRRGWRAPYSWVVGAVTRSYWTHAAVYVGLAVPTGGNGHAVPAVVEAENGGAQITALAEYVQMVKDGSGDFAWVVRGPSAYRVGGAGDRVGYRRERVDRAIAAAALGMVGTGYGWARVALLGAEQYALSRAVVRGVGVVMGQPDWVRHRLARRDQMFCSQLADWACQVGGVHMFKDERDAGDVTPNDLLEGARPDGQVLNLWGHPAVDRVK